MELGHEGLLQEDLLGGTAACVAVACDRCTRAVLVARVEDVLVQLGEPVDLLVGRDAVDDEKAVLAEELDLGIGRCYVELGRRQWWECVFAHVVTSS